MFNKMDKEHLCFWPSTKLLMNNLLNSWNEVGCLVVAYQTIFWLGLST